MDEQTTGSSTGPAKDLNQNYTNIASTSSPPDENQQPTTTTSSRLSQGSQTSQDSQSSVSSSSLRFPKPEGSQTLAHWVTSSSTDAPAPVPADNMSSSAIFDETSSLADSAYELISSCDGESQDGRDDSLAASITSSFNLYPRADDVHSINGTDTPYDDEEDVVDDEEEDEEDAEYASDDEQQMDQSSGYLPTQTRNTPGHSQMYHASHGIGEGSSGARRSSPADSMRYAEQALCNPSTQSLSSLEYDSSHGDISGGRSPLNQPIVFDEATGFGGFYFSGLQVKHTIREFSESESAIIVDDLAMVPARGRLAAAIRQTMSYQYLSHREPLHILYVGNDGAYNDIMHKISSAILASASSPDKPSLDNEHRRTSTPGTYNIIPISSFGSAKVPEIDEIQLMGVSDYYIKVDRCVKAEEVPNTGPSNSTVCSIELDNGETHKTAEDSRGMIEFPAWKLPHIAVFYVSGNDDEQAETTRSAAWGFMARYKVPCIFITHTQTFSRSPSGDLWNFYVDRHAVHMDLEPIDEEEKRWGSRRQPIDLASFLNIDARQMNRNLAFLSILRAFPSEDKGADDKTSSTKALSTKVSSTEAEGTLRGFFTATAAAYQLMRQGQDFSPEACQAVRELGSILFSSLRGLLAILLFTVLVWSASLYTGTLSSYFGFQTPGLPVATKYSQVTSAASISSPTALVSNMASAHVAVASSVCSIPSGAPTVTISFVTTKTVEIPMSDWTGHPHHVMFGGYLTENEHNQRNTKVVSDTEIKSTGCSIQVYSSHEILVKVPAATKTMWLAKGAIDIDVWQGKKVLKSKLFTTDEGIIIEINKKDAFGVMNVSIVTTRRPKINETFAVDFGQPTAARLFEAGLGLWQDSVRAAAQAGIEAASQAKKAASDFADEHKISLPFMEQVHAAVDETVATFNSLTSASKEAKHDLEEFWKMVCSVEPRRVLSKGLGVQANHLHHIVEEAQSAAKRIVPTDLGTDAAGKLRDDVRLSVRRAQIASKLWWLRVQGKQEEHDEYEAKAAEHMRELETKVAAEHTRDTTSTEVNADSAQAAAGENIKVAHQKGTTSTSSTSWLW